MCAGSAGGVGGDRDAMDAGCPAVPDTTDDCGDDDAAPAAPPENANESLSQRAADASAPAGGWCTVTVPKGAAGSEPWPARPPAAAAAAAAVAAGAVAAAGAGGVGQPAAGRSSLDSSCAGPAMAAAATDGAASGEEMRTLAPDCGVRAPLDRAKLVDSGSSPA